MRIVRRYRWPALLAVPLLAQAACSSYPNNTPRSEGPAPSGVQAATDKAATSQTAATPAAAEKPVQVQIVKYDGLKDAVKALKGRVVVVDFWSTT